MSWKPSNQPVRYDRKRVAQLQPIEAEINKLGLPLVRVRKLNGIRGAHIAKTQTPTQTQRSLLVRQRQKV